MLSFCHIADLADEGIFLLFLFVFIRQHLVFVARVCVRGWVWLLCVLVREQCDQMRWVPKCSCKRIVVSLVPTIQRLNLIQFTIAIPYIGPYRAGLWVSIDSIMNRKQNNFKQEERNTA